MKKSLSFSVVAILLFATVCKAQQPAGHVGNFSVCPNVVVHGPDDPAFINIVLTNGLADKPKLLDDKFAYYEIIQGLKIKELVAAKCANGNPNNMIPIDLFVYPDENFISIAGSYLEAHHDPRKGPGWNFTNHVKLGTAPGIDPYEMRKK